MLLISTVSYKLNCNFFNSNYKRSMLIILMLLIPLTIQNNITIYPYQQWKIRYNKTYANQSEDTFRKTVYQDNVNKLINSTCECCGITKFTADTEDQINKRNNLLLPPNIQELGRKQKNQNQKLMLTTSNQQLKLGAPSSLDWRDQGVVTSPKAQGTCGTCWSFATVGMSQSSLILQGRAFNNKLYSVDLSQQYLLKCTPGNSCSGGYLQNSIDKALSKGLPYQSQFPYSPYSPANNGICSTSDLIMISNATRISKYYTSDDVIIGMLIQGPVTAAVSAVGWQRYTSGVFQCSRNSQINHAVLLVGYTGDYWIIKNSWGKDWGQDGFIYVTRNPLYNCGIGTAVHSLSQYFYTTILCILVLCLFS